MTLKTKAFDASKYINTPEDVAELLGDAFASGHTGYIAAALGIAAKSHSMSKIAAETGLNRQALYAALTDGGNPSLDTVLKVTRALGVEMKATVAANDHAPGRDRSKAVAGGPRTSRSSSSGQMAPAPKKRPRKLQTA